MQSIRKFSGILVFLMCFNGIVSGQNAGLAFLKIGVDARAMALGNAVTAAVTGPSAAYWNPAGLVEGSALKAVFHHNQWLFGSSSEFVGLSSSHGTTAWGVFVNSFFIDDIEVRDIASTNPLATTNALFLTTGFSYARQVHPHWIVGATGKYIFQKIYVEQAGGWALDFGVKYRWRDRLQFGAVLQNVGRMAPLQEERTPLPVTFRWGVQWQPTFIPEAWHAMVTADVVKFRGQPWGASLGGELLWRKTIALRGGVLLGYTNRWWSIGIGLLKTRFQFHYALVPFTTGIGVTHQFTLGILLDGSGNRK